MACIALPVAAFTTAYGAGAVSWLGASFAACLCYASVGWRLRTRLGIDVTTTALESRRQKVSTP